MAVIPLPVSQSRISTLNWGIPISNQVNTNTNDIASLWAAITEINRRRLLARVRAITNISGVHGQAIPDLNLANIAVTAGRAYRISYNLGALVVNGPTVGSDRWNIQISESGAGGTIVRIFDGQNVVVPGTSYGVAGSYIHYPSWTSTVTYSFVTTQMSGTGTLQVNAAATVPRFAAIEDIGVIV